VTGLSCLSVTAGHAPLDVLERLSYPREELAGRLASLRANSRARAVAVLSTCQRTEVYATWPGEPDHPALLAALALDRGVSGRVLRPVATTYHGDAAARHLLRVASGLESFVLPGNGNGERLSWRPPDRLPARPSTRSPGPTAARWPASGSWWSGRARSPRSS